jgi:hypothetical protein
LTTEELPPAGAPTAGQCPRRKAIQEHALWDEMLLYAPGRETAFSLNGPAKAIWELCDGRHTLTDISRELSQRFSCSEETLAADVQIAVQRFDELGLLEWTTPSVPASGG